MLCGKINCFVYFLVTVFIIESLCERNYEKVEAVIGQNTELPCNVTAEKQSDKLTILAWYKSDSTAAFYSRDLRGHGEPATTSSDARYRLVTDDVEGLSLLQINHVTRDDKGVYQCLADFATSPTHKTYVQLEVIEPPEQLYALENDTIVANASIGVNTSQDIGPYYVGDVVHLACVAFGGHPQASPAWWSDQRRVQSTRWQRVNGSAKQVLSPQRVRSDMQAGPLQREDHGRVFTCLATNNEKVPPLAIDITIDMLLPPYHIQVRSEEGGSGRARAGDSLRLQCRVLGARPLPDPIWKLGENQLILFEKKVTEDSSQRFVVSEIELPVDRENDEALITCCVPSNRRDGEQFTCAKPMPLNVLYPPVLEIVANEDVQNGTLAVTKGSSLTLACNHQANPSIYELYWLNKDNSTSDKDKPIQQLLELSDVSENDAGKYYCVASNTEGSTRSAPITIDVTYPAYCEDEENMEYGLGENDVIQLNCSVVANPGPSSYRWVIANEAVDASNLPDQPNTTIETDEPTLLYRRPNGTAYSTIFCWGQNNVPAKHLPHTPCTFRITDETIPRAPTNCEARKNSMNDIVVSCDKGYDGGLTQKFKFILQPVDSDEHLVSIINFEPKFMVQEPKSDDYKFVIIAFNDKGESASVEIEKDSVIDEELVPPPPGNTVKNLTTLALALCGGVALVALAACGLVLFTHERAARHDLAMPRARHDPPLCAYNTEESNCETCHDSDDGSECNVRRTESFRRAVSRQPSRNFDVRRTSSFHSARYMHDAAERDTDGKRNDTPRHNNHCRVHSLQNINRKRDMDALCDHLVLHLPPETNYNVPRPMNTFYTMPRKMRHKLAKELSDENSEITQTSDGFSLPPPPDEFTTYRAGARIKDMPTKSTPTYTTVIKNNTTGIDPNRQYNNVIISPMNTVGLPAGSGGHHTAGAYSYPDDDHLHGHQDTQTASGAFTTFQTTYKL